MRFHWGGQRDLSGLKTKGKERIVSKVIMNKVWIRIPALVWVICFVLALYRGDWLSIILVLVLLPIVVLYEAKLYDEANRRS